MRNTTAICLLALGLTACGAAAPATSTTPCPGPAPSRIVTLSCEIAEQRADAAETVVSHPRATIRTGRSATITSETPAGLLTAELTAGDAGTGFTIAGTARLENHGATLAHAEAPTPPTDAVALRVAASPALSYEVRCKAGEPAPAN